ncbi:glycosyltransferase [Kaistella polysaccharea]|uniref:glycosyltransferase n=1 Tax=Kaistella polysaccharea TaxID=2878534 RepID=UPI001CF16090|nr:glycosyltransferase [Kaistella polysaccharea]
MIAAVTILYNPQPDVLQNIETYIEHVDKLYLIDNSDASNEQMLQRINAPEKVVYIFNNENLGIASALNIGCKTAIKDGFEWILTMDQDSKILTLEKFFKDALDPDNKTALYYPTYIINGAPYQYQILENEKPVVVMTSGNILNLEAYTAVSGFEDKLFIDYVDIDFCLKLKLNGYQLKELEGYKIAHELGKSKLKQNLLFKILLTNHPLIRRYYITRNKFYMLKTYKNITTFYDKEKYSLLKELVKIILFEDEKVQKLKIMYTAYEDFKMNKFGKKR